MSVSDNIDVSDDVFAVLRKYQDILDNHQEDYITYDLKYTWMYYTNNDIKRFRDDIIYLDQYWMYQHNYVLENTNKDCTHGPELNRLPDNALLAMFQEIDEILAKAKSIQDSISIQDIVGE